MPLPPKLRQKYLDRFDELIAEGRKVLDSVIWVKKVDYNEYLWSSKTGGTWTWDHSRHTKWKVNCLSLLDQILHQDHIHRRLVASFGSPIPRSEVEKDISNLAAIRYDLEHDFLGDVAAQIEAEVASGYMGQAEGLLNEGQRGSFDHVPAAVLAGAVLERSLRAACASQVPPIPLEQLSHGRMVKKMLNVLIDDVKGAGLYNETRAKQLRGWAAIRNHAAHGEFDQFTRSQVEEMVTGIKTFLADVLG